MVSVMKDFDIVTKSSHAETANAETSIFGVERHLQGARVIDCRFHGALPERSVPPVLYLAEKVSDLEGESSKNGWEVDSVSLAAEAKVVADISVQNSVCANEVGNISFLESGIWMHGFRIGDMVWGKVKSHPWWPGHIFNEAFASSSVRGTKTAGHVLVAFFGDSSYGWFDPAELIPFEPHFPEKSGQTTSCNFVRAVEEAVDEVSRRGTLAMACCCRNVCNFRPASVTGYFAVDVVGCEPVVVYSSTQIKEARNRFAPRRLLSFVQQLALSPHSSKEHSIDWIQSIAMLTAYRKVVFEEFDETYAQAFGLQPTWSTPSYASVMDQLGRFAPRVGQHVIAQIPGEHSTKLSSHKPAKAAKTKRYLIKRREDLPYSATVNFLPDLRPASLSPDSNYVLQKKENPSPPASAVTTPFHEQKSSEPALPTLGYLEKSEPFKAKNVSMLQKAAMDKQENIRKRPGDDVNEAGKFTKTKRDSTTEAARRLIGIAVRTPEFVPREFDTDLPQGLDLVMQELRRLLADLSCIALDPFHGSERGTPAVVRQVFLRFRSVVYQKGRVFPTAIGQEDVAASCAKEGRCDGEQTILKEPKDSQEQFSVKADRKRGPSNRQEELRARTIKKIDHTKSLATEKRAAIGQENNQVQRQKDLRDSHQELPSPKIPSPTFLVMKFPPRATLPSIANLKARFARFGPLDLSAARVYWKTYSCKILFRYKSDAQAAYDFVMKNDLFGQVKVAYHLRDSEVSGEGRTPNSPKKTIESSLLPPGSAGLPLSDPTRKLLQPKSILKRPGGEVSRSHVASRVRFMLSDNGDGEPTKVVASGKKAQKSLGLFPPQLTAGRPPADFQRIEGLLSSSSAGEPLSKSDVDISGPMLSLLLKCNDVVNNVKASIGYISYHVL
ncbi:hypothetical protein HPP92_016315 [Vanilla planifolia]|uniref:PWWP domain-containing protein n=1 Tax=Vanilla planifolia TaxID=51239 RepID=A0A835QFV8_VANPL|nr:hypothetical protein HPP92_016315 [Vanilla planifolia]